MSIRCTHYCNLFRNVHLFPVFSLSFDYHSGVILVVLFTCMSIKQQCRLCLLILFSAVTFRSFYFFFFFSFCSFGYTNVHRLVLCAKWVDLCLVDDVYKTVLENLTRNNNINNNKIVCWCVCVCAYFVGTPFVHSIKSKFCSFIWVQYRIYGGWILYTI